MCIHTYIFIHAPVSVILKRLWTKKYKKHKCFVLSRHFFLKLYAVGYFCPIHLYLKHETN